jgi:uncharacterized protein
MDLWHIAAVDQHAHNLPENAHTRARFVGAFTESCDPALVDRHARSTLFFRRSVRDIADLLRCDPGEDAILTRREEIGLDALAALCFEQARLETILLDDGLDATGCWPVERHTRFVDSRRVLRLETLALEAFHEAEQFDGFVDGFVGAIDPLPSNVVALKSIAAYRSGLAIEPVSMAAAAKRFQTLKREVGTGEFRLVDKTLGDVLLVEALQVAAKYGIPVQLHTGFGDTDLDLRLSNPLHFRRVLEDPRLRSVPIVLLHASYPFVREGGYLASVYSNVYLDCGLAVPYLSVSGMRSVFRQLLELAPSTKILYSSDAHAIPELFYLGAKWGREALGFVLDEAIRDGDLLAREAEEVALAILRENARTLYGLQCDASGPPRKQ